MAESVAVLGASGYVGSAIVVALESAGYDVSPVAGSSHDTYPVVDVRDREAIAEFLEGVSCVVNAAGLVGIDACTERPDAAFDINATGAATVAWTAGRREIPLVQLSSVATIGPPKTTPITADATRTPTTVYGRTKLCGDRAVEAVTARQTPSITILLTNPYGSPTEDSTGGNSVVDFFLERAVAGKSLPVHRPGTQERDLICIRDVAAAIVAAVSDLTTNTAELDARTYVLGSGDAYSILEVAGLVAAAVTERTGSSPDLELCGRPHTDQPVIDRFDVDTSRIESDLGVEPTVDLRTWLEREVATRVD